MGNVVKRLPSKKILLSAAVMLVMPLTSYADKTDDIVNRGINRAKAGASSQLRIDKIAEATDKIVSKYQQESKVVEGLKVYNDRLRRTITAQEEAMTKLERSIEDASLIERQIVPLMLRMIEGLDTFIQADIPFKPKERNDRVARIRSYLTNANISAAERFRQVLNAYQIESDYGKKIYVYTDELALADGNITVNILQVGRAGLYYQTLDGALSGHWDNTERAWKQLDAAYNEGISTSIRIAQGKEPANLMELPLAAPEAS